MIAVYINTVLSAMLFYTCFCRLVRTSIDTFPGVRVAFVSLAIASAVCLVAPFLSPYVPQWPALVMEGAMAFVQALTAKYWKDGVPCHFQKLSHEDRNEVHP